MRGPVVRWLNTQTGEVKERSWSGIEDGEEWEETALELALGLVPDLEVWIDMARMKDRTIEVKVSLDDFAPWASRGTRE